MQREYRRFAVQGWGVWMCGVLACIGRVSGAGPGSTGVLRPRQGTDGRVTQTERSTIRTPLPVPRVILTLRRRHASVDVLGTGGRGQPRRARLSAAVDLSE